MTSTPTSPERDGAVAIALHRAMAVGIATLAAIGITVPLLAAERLA